MRSGWIALVAGAAALLSGCGTQQAEIAEVRFSSASAELEVVVNTCNRDPTVTVLTGGDEVWLSAEVARRWSPFGSDGCQDVVPVGLSEPVGQRPVVDTATDREFESGEATG